MVANAKKFKPGDIVVITDNSEAVEYRKGYGDPEELRKHVPIGLVCRLASDYYHKRGARIKYVMIDKELSGLILNGLYTSKVSFRYATEREEFLFYITGPYEIGKEDGN